MEIGWCFFPGQVCVCVCVCVWARERERERVSKHCWITEWFLRFASHLTSCTLKNPNVSAASQINQIWIFWRWDPGIHIFFKLPKSVVFYCCYNRLRQIYWLKVKKIILYFCWLKVCHTWHWAEIKRSASRLCSFLETLVKMVPPAFSRLWSRPHSLGCGPLLSFLSSICEPCPPYTILLQPPSVGPLSLALQCFFPFKDPCDYIGHIQIFQD